MAELSSIGALSAFGAGVVSFLSPCVLPLVPGYLSYLGGRSLDELKSRRFASGETLRLLGLSLGFVLGFSTVFIAFGAGASLLGRWLAAHRYELNILGGVVVFLFGLFMTGLVKLSWLQRDLRFHGRLPAEGALASYLLGIAFAFGWTPCIGPILGAILTLSATSTLVSDGTALLAIYSLGLGVPFVVAGLFTGRFLRQMAVLRKHLLLLHRIAGGILMAMGVAMATGYLTDFSLWLLKAFPWLGEIG